MWRCIELVGQVEGNRNPTPSRTVFPPIGVVLCGCHVVGGRGGAGVGERAQTLRVSETRKVFGRSIADALSFADSAERVRRSARFSASAIQTGDAGQCC